MLYTGVGKERVGESKGCENKTIQKSGGIRYRGKSMAFGRHDDVGTRLRTMVRIRSGRSLGPIVSDLQED